MCEFFLFSHLHCDNEWGEKIKFRLIIFQNVTYKNSREEKGRKILKKSQRSIFSIFLSNNNFDTVGYHNIEIYGSH